MYNFFFVKTNFCLFKLILKIKKALKEINENKQEIKLFLTKYIFINYVLNLIVLFCL